MLQWLKSWIWTSQKMDIKEEEPLQTKKSLSCGRHTLSLHRILEWWAKEPQLDPLPPYPPSPRKA